MHRTARRRNRKARRASVPAAGTQGRRRRLARPGRRRRLTAGSRGGFFAGPIADRKQAFRYRLRLLPYGSEQPYDIEDPYRFGQVLGELDIHLLVEGTHLRAFEKLGAHVATIDGVAGTTFAVWAPNARKVQRRRRLQRLGRPSAPDALPLRMRRLGNFLPGVGRRRRLQVRDQGSVRQPAGGKGRPVRR